MTEATGMLRVFISWSGPIANEIAHVLEDWLPRVIHTVDPWVSDTDIAKGTFWNQEVIKGLQGAKIGVIVLTPDNLDRPWLHFEAGFLARAITEEMGGMVAPLLINVRNSEIAGPMATLQVTSYAKNDVLKLLKSINSHATPRISDAILEENFDLRWPRLTLAINEALARHDEAQTKAPLDTDSVLEEILDRVRSLSVTTAVPRVTVTADHHTQLETQEQLHRALLAAKVPTQAIDRVLATFAAERRHAEVQRMRQAFAPQTVTLDEEVSQQSGSTPSSSADHGGGS